MKTVELKIKSDAKASRLEVIIRLLYSIPLLIVAGILWAVAWIAIAVQALHILALAKRNSSLSAWVKKAVAYTTKLHAYCCLLTDERPKIMPED